jgi:hypothetical protein
VIENEKKFKEMEKSKTNEMEMDKEKNEKIKKKEKNEKLIFILFILFNDLLYGEKYENPKTNKKILSLL